MRLIPSRILPIATLALLPSLLFAQVAAPTSEPSSRPAKKAVVVETTPAAKKPDEPIHLEGFEVTGSRIRTLNAEVTAVPVFTLSQVELERRGVNRIADIRWAIPQLGGSVGFNDNLTNSGTSRAQTSSTSFNLRGLGGNSTLVMIDGRRMPHTGQEAPGGAGGREDFSVDGIPVSAIERIDILPEGAGAIYGSEAIAGVINIILKKNYTGSELSVSYDNAFRGDVAQSTVTLTGGYSVGKLSTFFTASFENQNGMLGQDRWFTSTFDSRRFGSTSTNFLFGATAGAGSLSTGSAPAISAQANLPGLSTNVVLLPAGSNGSTAANSGYTPTTPAGVPIFDAGPYASSVDPAKRINLLARANYQLLPHAEVYGDFRWSRDEKEYYGTPITLGVALPVGYPGNPFTSAAYLSKVFYDLPVMHTTSIQRNLGGAVGVRGDFLTTWRYDVSAQWSRNIVTDDAITGGFFFTALSAAMASANKPILAYDSLAGKDPNAAGVLSSLMPVADHEDTTDVYQYSVSADGSVWSGWAGDVKLALGAEAGKEEVKFYREPSPITPTYVLTLPFERSLTATFAEMTVPLLSDRQHLPLVHRLEVGAAIRATDYSDIGGVTTPSMRALFQPVKWLTFRVSRAEGFKPVRLYDLLAPVSAFTTTLTPTSNVRDPLRGNEVILGTYNYISGGNKTLNPENSVSKNGGVVIDVPGSLFRGLSFSADYYQLDFTDRSGSTNLQTLLNYFPERITRAAPTPADTAAGYAGRLVTYDASNINLVGVRTKGWDYSARYSRAFTFGEIMVNASYSNPDVTTTKASPAAAPTSTFGHQPSKGSVSAFWGNGRWDAGVAVNYQARYFINGLTAAAYPSYIEWNPGVSYRFHNQAASSAWWDRSLAGMKLSLTLVNVFDREPSLLDAANGRVVMDPRLSRYILTATKKF